LENNLNILPIKKIRQIINKPYRAFWLSVSEFDFVQKTSVFILVGLLLFEAYAPTIFPFSIFWLYIPFIWFLVFMIKKVQKKLGDGVVFFIMKDLSDIRAIFDLKRLDTNKIIKTNPNNGFEEFN
jgi:hypothetical protein